MSVESKVNPKTVGCFSMGNVVLFIICSRLFLYSTGVNRGNVVISGFSMRLLFW